METHQNALKGKKARKSKTQAMEDHGLVLLISLRFVFASSKENTPQDKDFLALPDKREEEKRYPVLLALSLRVGKQGR